MKHPRTLVVGDIHGRARALEALLKRVDFDPGRDRLCCVGDLVNKGNSNGAVIDIFMSLGNSATCVLGNHDILLLGIYYGVFSPDVAPDLDDVLNRADLDRIVSWYRFRRLVMRLRDCSVVLVHAGLAPQWSLARTLRESQKVERILQAGNVAALLSGYLSEGMTEPAKRSLNGTLHEERYALQLFTLVREISPTGRLPVGTESRRTPDMQPWFEYARWKQHRKHTICFGHWASLGGFRTSRIIGLDTGCGNDGELTAVQVGSGTVFSENCGSC